jgi:hypothetical protein
MMQAAPYSIAAREPGRIRVYSTSAARASQLSARAIVSD